MHDCLTDNSYDFMHILYFFQLFPTSGKPACDSLDGRSLPPASAAPTHLQRHAAHDALMLPHTTHTSPCPIQPPYSRPAGPPQLSPGRGQSEDEGRAEREEQVAAPDQIQLQMLRASNGQRHACHGQDRDLRCWGQAGQHRFSTPKHEGDPPKGYHSKMACS